MLKYSTAPQLGLFKGPKLALGYFKAPGLLSEDSYASALRTELLDATTFKLRLNHSPTTQQRALQRP